MHIVELSRKLQENRSENPPVTKYRARTAKIDDAAKLIKAGYSTGDISDFSGLSVDVIESERNRIQERDLARRRYLATMKMESPDVYGMPTVHTIYQR